MSDLLPSLISGASGIVGNLLGNSAARKAAAQQAALQKEFAQNGIRWKVADAKAAGLHPLAALGAQTTSYQPVSVQQDYSAFGSMGQDISRAMLASADAKERTAIQQEQMQMQRETHAANINRVNAETALDEMRMREIASRVNRNASAQLGPAFPSVRRGGTPNNYGSYVINPAEITSQNKSDISLTAGPDSPMWTNYRMFDGKYPFNVKLPSEQASESMESAGEIVAPILILGKNIPYLGRQVIEHARKLYGNKVADYLRNHRRKNIESRKRVRGY